jgi:hypothetical protein
MARAGVANAAPSTADHRFVLHQAMTAAGNMIYRTQECTRVRTGVVSVSSEGVAVAVRDGCDSDVDARPIISAVSAVSGMTKIKLPVYPELERVEERTPLTRRWTFSM